LRKFTGDPGEHRHGEFAQSDDSGSSHLPHLREDRSVFELMGRRRRHDDQHRTGTTGLTSLFRSPFRPSIAPHGPVGDGA